MIGTKVRLLNSVLSVRTLRNQRDDLIHSVLRDHCEFHSYGAATDVNVAAPSATGNRRVSLTAIDHLKVFDRPNSCETEPTVFEVNDRGRCREPVVVGEESSRTVDDGFA